MNLLAHAHLGWQLNDVSFSSNVLWDYIARRDRRRTTTGLIRDGARFHQFIDQFTDTSAEVAMARSWFPAKRRLAAGVILDIAFDYFLIRRWEEFAHRPKREFDRAVYERIRRTANRLGSPIAPLVENLTGHAWFRYYETLEGLGETFRRIARRSRAAELLIGAEIEIARLDSELEELFGIFYPRLQGAVAGWIEEHRIPLAPSLPPA